jgi:hypothetical protein
MAVGGTSLFAGWSFGENATPQFRERCFLINHS